MNYEMLITKYSTVQNSDVGSFNYYSLIVYIMSSASIALADSSTKYGMFCPYFALKISISY
jgi:hypothetical protein